MQSKSVSKNILLQSPGFLGDEVVFTGVVRELKKQTGWNFRIKTTRPELWTNNNSIVGIGLKGDEDIILDKDYCPPYHQMSQAPLHYLEQYLRNIRDELGLSDPYQVSKFAGNVIPSGKEVRSRPFDLPSRYWLIVPGWKTSVPAKGWPTASYQQVVDSLRGRVFFVQAGSKASWHPKLRGVVNVVGQTSLRQLIRLIYHAEGVVCPITSIMHLAAAIPTAPSASFAIRPCVVIAGGRESPHYINYPMHRVFSTLGLLPCCASSACGKSHFGEGHCPLPTLVAPEVVPKCMTLIQPADVVSAVEYFYRGGASIPPRIGRVEAISRRIFGLSPPSNELIHGVILGDARAKISSQLLLGHSNLDLKIITGSTSDSSCLISKSPSDKARAAANDQALQATEFARHRCQLIHSLEIESLNFDDKKLSFGFLESSQGSESDTILLNYLLGKVQQGGFLGGTGYQKESIRELVNRFAQINKLKIRPDKDNTWFVEL